MASSMLSSGMTLRSPLKVQRSGTMFSFTPPLIMVILSMGLRLFMPMASRAELEGTADLLDCTSFLRDMRACITGMDLSTALMPRKLEPLWADRP